MARDEVHNAAQQQDERQPLLQRSSNDAGETGDDRVPLDFTDDDPDNPRQWTYKAKMANVFVISLMSILTPLASSMFTPGVEQIAKGLDTTTNTVIACTTVFVIMMGLGPLLLAPLSETFGRRPLYLICFAIFALLQIPSALSPNIATLLAMRTLSGFFGSVGVANGGGSLNDMFTPDKRASVYGWYLLAPLLGPTVAPVFGSVILARLGWRWIFWVLAIVCSANTIAAFFFLRETYAPVILIKRKQRLEREEGAPNKYRCEGEDDRPLRTKLRHALTRPLRILIQPIVLTMSIYQALLFGTTYSIYTNMQPIYEGEYGFDTEKVGLLYLGPGLGFLTSVWFLVPRIDTVYNALTRRNAGKAAPEFRLPLANIGAVFIPIALFWFAWSVEFHAAWYVSIIATYFYGIGMVMIINTTTNYYIDTFSKYAASAIAAGAVFRAVVGGIVPLVAPSLFDRLGYGWGISVFAFLAVALAPAPLVFYYYGRTVRKRYSAEL